MIERILMVMVRIVQLKWNYWEVIIHKIKDFCEVISPFYDERLMNDGFPKQSDEKMMRTASRHVRHALDDQACHCHCDWQMRFSRSGAWSWRLLTGAARV